MKKRILAFLLLIALLCPVLSGCGDGSAASGSAKAEKSGSAGETVQGGNITVGIAQDLGGTQPYIAVGAGMFNSARFKRVIALRQRGLSYKAVADATGITAAHVRRIEHAWRQEQFAARQCALPLVPEGQDSS